MKAVLAALSLGAFTGLLGCADTRAPVTADRAVPNALAAPALETIPPNKDSDLRLFYRDGHIVTGKQALSKMSADSDLTLWLAGNQFFAMQEVIRTFQREYPASGNIAVITLPPGIILNAINKGGWRYQGTDFRMTPDVYASVNLDHLKALKRKGEMSQYMTYTRNKLELIVAKGNPKKIRGIEDLARSDVRVMLPNPVTEGIMKFYAKKVLVRRELWEQLSGGKECQSCQATPRVYFTSVHHREIPDALKLGTTDVGIVWASEAQHAREEGIEVEGIALPAQDSLVDEVAYVIGVLNNAKNASAGRGFLDFLKTEKAQEAYAKYGFIKATRDDLVLKAVP